MAGYLPVIRIEPDGPTSEEEVSAFEDEFGLALPPEYRTWLLTVGGGKATDDPGLRNGVVNEFLALGKLDYDLAFARRLTTGPNAWVPREWVLITAASGGDVAVKVDGGDVGSIWWADFDEGTEIESDLEEERGAPFDEAPVLPQIMYRLTDTLRELLEEYPVDLSDYS